MQAKQLAKLGQYPFPVVEVHLIGGEIRRYSFWCPADKPSDAEKLGTKCAHAFFHPETIERLVFERMPAQCEKRQRINWKDYAISMAKALERVDPEAPELLEYHNAM